MKKVALTICVHERHELTDLCYQGIERVRPQFKKLGYELQVYICASWDKKHIDLAKKFNYRVFNTDNKPISLKYRHLLKNAMLDDWDFWLLLGSDDFFTEDAAKNICEQMSSDKKAGMPKNIYFFSLDSASGFEFKNVQRCGAGRWYRRDVLDQSGDFYNFIQNYSLDRHSEHNIYKATGIKPFRFDGSYVCDVKSNENINSFNDLKKYYSIKDYGSLSISDYIPEFDKK